VLTASRCERWRMTKTKTDNANPASKLELRRYMLRKYHVNGDIRVFECCQGSGLLWGQLQKEFVLTSRWGVDLKPKAGRLKIDSVKVLAQPGLNANVIDIDTYGAPWKHWAALLPNITEDTTVFLTSGLVTMGGGSTLSREARAAAGIPEDWNLSPVFTGWILEYSTSHLLTMGCGDCTIEEVAESTRGKNARYFAVRIKKADDVRASPAAQRKLQRSKRHV
jgi:hypothetical protein